MKRSVLVSHVFTITLSVLCIVLCIVLDASAVSIDRNSSCQDFSKYQLILDRMPFGALPANFGQNAASAEQTQTDAQVKAEQQKLAKQVNMSCVNVTPDGSTAIGFTDLDAKPPVNYYLLVGATAGGWSVVAADYDEEWAQIKKEDITITLKLGKGLIDAPPPTHAPALTAEKDVSSPDTPQFGSIRRPALAGRGPPSPASSQARLAESQKLHEEITKVKESGGDLGSYMDRLRERKQQEKAEKAAAEQAAREQLQNLARKITEEELKKEEREMNLNLIEQGAHPISDIELTPEEEAVLVQKGVLAQ